MKACIYLPWKMYVPVIDIMAMLDIGGECLICPLITLLQ